MLEATEEGAGRLRVAVQGDLDAQGVEAMRAELREKRRPDHLHFVFDFEGVHFVCSAGLGFLVEIYNSVADQGGTLLVLNMNDNVRTLFKATKLLDIFTTGPADDHRRIKALDAVQRHMSRELVFVSYLNRITTEVLQAQGMKDIARLVLEGALRSMRTRRGLLLGVEEAGEGRRALHLSASEGFDDSVLGRVEGLALEPDSLEGQAVEAREARLLSRAAPAGAPAASPLLAATGMSGAAVAPMAGDSTLFGLLMIEIPDDAPDAGEPESLMPHAAPLLQTFANVCGLAIEKQRFLEDIRRKNQQLARTLSELNRTQGALMEASRLATLAALSQGLGHALNNKLVPIIGYTQILAMDAEPGSPMRRKIEIIDKAANEIKGIVDNIRTMTGRSCLALQTVDLREICDTALHMLDHLFRDARIRVERTYSRVDASVPADRENALQAFLSVFNRLPGAFAGMSGERGLRIEMKRGSEDLAVVCRDNGRPISEEDLRSIEDPVSRYALPSLSGDLFNLGTVHTILKNHKGAVEVESAQGGGTSVVMRFPLHQGTLEGAPDATRR